MGKMSRKISFKNATLDFKNMKITEIGKDIFKEYDLKTILKDWDAIENISFTISTDDELPEIAEDAED